MCRKLEESKRSVLHACQLPLPSARLKLSGEDPIRRLIETILKEDSLELAQMKLKHLRQPFFSRGERSAFYVPANLQSSLAADELNSGKQKLLLTFDLPRGCYATMLVKRITQVQPALVTGA
jgi:tRNA pseudouridine13 synthase